MRIDQSRRLIFAGRSQEGRIQIQNFPIGVVRFESEPSAGALDQGHIQRMVAGVALIEPSYAVAHIEVRARHGRHVGRALRHYPLIGYWDGRARVCNAAADAPLRVRAHLGRGGVDRQRDVRVVGLAADIAHHQHHVFAEPAVHGKAPLLNGRCVHVGINDGRGIDRARLTLCGATGGRQCGSPLERDQIKHSSPRREGILLAGVRGCIGIDPYSQVILKIVMDSKTRPHRPSSSAGRVPGQTHARLQQQFGVIPVQA